MVIKNRKTIRSRSKIRRIMSKTIASILSIGSMSLANKKGDVSLNIDESFNNIEKTVRKG